MSSLQVAIIVLAAAVVVALFLITRHEKAPKEGAPLEKPRLSPEGFDEFGVGQPRARGGERIEPSVGPGARPPPTAAGGEAPASAVPDKVVAFYIKEREGTHILGPQIHKALLSQGLSYGERQLYHRMQGQRPVFSVASLLKPGALIPDEAKTFSTPGLSVFMVLPAPVPPVAAFIDMLETSQKLAAALNAELLDDRRDPLTRERTQALRAEVQDWAQRAEGAST